MSKSTPRPAGDHGRRATAEKRPGRRVRAGNDSSPPWVKAKKSAREGRPLYQFIARTGYLARGLVYAIVGLVALSAAAGTRKNALSLTDALQKLLQRPFGLLLISGIAVGMVCFACWRLAQGLLDPPDSLGTESRAAVRRAAYAISSLAYLGIAAVAAGIVFELPSPHLSSPQGWAAWVLGWPSRISCIGIGGGGLFGDRRHHLGEGVSRALQK